jgi:hypothetical protein
MIAIRVYGRVPEHAEAGVASVKLPPRSPNLNAYAERFVRPIKESCLERVILFGESGVGQRRLNSWRLTIASATTKIWTMH